MADGTPNRCGFLGLYCRGLTDTTNEDGWNDLNGDWLHEWFAPCRLLPLKSISPCRTLELHDDWKPSHRIAQPSTVGNSIIGR